MDCAMMRIFPPRWASTYAKGEKLPTSTAPLSICVRRSP